ncbi:proton-coupled folate transporter-like [Trichoplusia ni]|uniref:Proton-coupled folate transporter-like n=1 Tax=Trichoplusia ni TaxID=7111 RepID=A0A7E5VNI7_TRINI|nr:proton-coupled folate transporter-like [Trichoplusia ni]
MIHVLVATASLQKMGNPEEQPLKDKGKPKKKSFREKLANIRRNITVEPVLACYVVPGVLSRLATQNLNLDKACRVNMAYGDVVCDALIAREGNKHLKEELAIQELIAAMETWKNVLLTAIPSILILFLGAWSDRTGKRKICILLPIIGDLIVCLSNMLNAYFFYELPVQVMMFFEALFPAITGGWITTYMGVFAYISDVSSEESRTFRVGIANLCLTAGGPIGSVLSGFLLKFTGYYGVFTISSLLYLFSILYGFIYIKDPERPMTKKPSQNESSSARGFLKSFFDIKHVKDTLTVAFKNGPNKRRTKSILILASIAFIYGPAHGEYTIRYLFTRYRFNWDALKYSFYSTFYICIHALGALISISVFSHRLKWDDSVLGLISNVSKVMGALSTGLARNSMEMYLAVAIEMFNATSFTALRSISSKLVTSDELGKMTSFFNLMEVVTAMIFGPAYSWIYMFTLQIDAGIVYYVSTVLTVPPFCIFVWFFIQNRKDKRKSLDEKCSNPGVEAIKQEEPLRSSIDLEHEMVVLE